MLSRLRKAFKSISVRLPLLFISSSLIISFFVLITSYNRFEDRMISEHTRMAEGVTSMMEEAIDLSKIDYYIEENYDSEEYMSILRYFHTLKDNYPDVHYLYVYKYIEEGGLVIFELDEVYQDPPPQESRDWIGQVYIYDETSPEIEKLRAGKEPVVNASHTHDGEYLLSYARPLHDENGNYVCSAGVDFSMDYMHNQDIEFVKKTALIIALILVMIWIVDVTMIRVIILNPISKIARAIHQFRYETESDRFHNVELLEGINLRTENQIDELYYAFLSVMKESVYYMSNFNKAKIEINEISKTVYKDALTQVGSKTSYDNQVKTFQDMIGKDRLEFAAIMIDINNLKYVNDTFGHDKGDAYIKGCCHIICDVFKKSPVYRIGGDEFVVFLQNNDYLMRYTLLELLQNKFEESYSDDSKEAYERYTASSGMAVFDQDIDQSVADVVKRADKEMYNNKMVFKKEHGSYR